MLEYIAQIAPRIPFYRCVFDIAQTKNGFILIEFNSWETNSGAHFFYWIDDTEIFYPEVNNNEVVFKWGTLGSELIVKQVSFPQIPRSLTIVGEKVDDLTSIQVLKPNQPSNWLVTSQYLYISNDTWLGMFTLDLKPICWKRGVFRFCHLQLCSDGSIFAELYYNSNLSVKKTKSQVIKQNEYKGDEYPTPPFKYGFVGKINNKFVFCRLLHDGTFRIIFY